MLHAHLFLHTGNMLQPLTKLKKTEIFTQTGEAPGGNGGVGT